MYFEDTHAVSEIASEKAESISLTLTEAAEENHSQYQISSYTVSSFPAASKNSSNQEKISLFLSLFKGRSDVCAKRWKNKPGYSPYCYNDFKSRVCQKPRIKCAKCGNSDFAPLNYEEIKKHLMGNHVLGLYPLTTKDTCYLLAMDFDESTWKDDVSVVRKLCGENRIPVYAERSRSGNGCHLWFFFDKEIKASVARKFGMAILDFAMQESKNIRFDSYDRLFPSQDFLQKDGFGNLIALPLQGEARTKHNSLFIDDAFEAIDDQWGYLSQVSRITEAFIATFLTLHKITGSHTQFNNEAFSVEKNYDHSDAFHERLQVEQNDFPDPDPHTK